MIDLATSLGGREIWVAAGTYIPTRVPQTTSTPITARDKTFFLKPGVKLYGGFAGTETERSERDRIVNVTVLSGDLEGDDNVTGSGSTLSITGNTENVHHVVMTVDIPNDGETILDGFTVTGGNADGSGDINISGYTVRRHYGGGMYNSSSSPVLTNVTISRNRASSSSSNTSYGGGMYNSSSSPVLTNIIISENQVYAGNSSSFGGGMYNSSSSPVLTNVTISGNQVGGGTSFSSYGGGMYNTSSSSPVLTNVSISGNQARAGTSYGGGMYNTSSSSPVLTNVSISGNQARADSANSYGGGMYNNNSESVLINVSISGNQAYADSGNSSGGGMYNNSKPVLTNVTISGNAAFGYSNSYGGGMYNYHFLPEIRNSIIWGNGSSNVYNSYTSTFTSFYSLIQGENLSGTGNLDGTNAANDPLFEDPRASTAAPTTEGDYRLQAGSPVINAGSDGLYPANAGDNIFPSGLSAGAKAAINAALSYDLSGSTARKNDVIDMGSYERQ
jgi:hypothetical protein